MNKAKKALLHIMVFVILFVTLCHPIEVHAETKEAELITIEEERDLVVMFSYDKEIVDIIFISPDGVRYADSDKDVETSSGELWKTYRIIKENGKEISTTVFKSEYLPQNERRLIEQQIDNQDISEVGNTTDNTIDSIAINQEEIIDELIQV